MAKIMLVEDDNNLREIYEARLLAEGYEIVSAHDGEEALAVAVKEKPDLIISDVMMPKISGFDMLDILRTTPETKNTKVVMMTALSQVEDRERANKLGADKYLVKSQVTLEDVAKVAREMLEGGPPADSSVPATPAAEAVVASATVAPESPADTSNSATDPATELPSTSTDDDQVSVDSSPTADENSSEPAVAVVDPPADDSSDGANPPEPPPESPPDNEPDGPKEPPKTDNAAATAAISNPSIDPNLSQTTANEEADIEKQIDAFVQSTYGEGETEKPATASEQAQTEKPPSQTIADSSELDGDDSNTSPLNPIAASSANVKQIQVAEAPIDTTQPNTGLPLRATSSLSPEPVVTTPTEVAGTEDNEPTVQAAEPRAPITKEPADGNISGKKVIMPLNDLTKPVDMNRLLQAEHDKESVQEAVQAAAAPEPGPVFASVDDDSDAPPTTSPPGTTIGPDPNAIAL
ncbi:MAG: response regulator [Patescibacteria group bacterium]